MTVTVIVRPDGEPGMVAQAVLLNADSTLLAVPVSTAVIAKQLPSLNEVTTSLVPAMPLATFTKGPAGGP